MALLSFADSTPRAYRLKPGNAARKVSTHAGTSPSGVLFADHDELDRVTG